MRARLLVPVAAVVLLVPSGADPAGAAVHEERSDEVQVDGATCVVGSRQLESSDGTIELSTGSHSASAGGDSEACFWGAVEARVRYTYRDADGDLQSGQAVAPRVVVLTLPSAGVTELRSFHQVVYFDGTTTPEFTLPK